MHFCPFSWIAACLLSLKHIFYKGIILLLSASLLFLGLPASASALPLVPLPEGTSLIGYWYYTAQSGKVYYHFVFEQPGSKIVVNIQRIAQGTGAAGSGAAVGLGAIALSIPAATIYALKQVYDREQALQDIEIINSQLDPADAYSLSNSPLELIESATEGDLPSGGDPLEFVRKSLCASIEGSNIYTNPDPCTAAVSDYKVKYNKELFRACVALEKWYRHHNGMTEAEELAIDSPYNFNRCFLANQTDGCGFGVDQEMSFNTDGSLEEESAAEIVAEIEESVEASIETAALDVAVDLGAPDGYLDDEFSGVLIDVCREDGQKYGTYDFLANAACSSGAAALDDDARELLDGPVSEIIAAAVDVPLSLEEISVRRDDALNDFNACMYCEAVSYYSSYDPILVERAEEYGCNLPPFPGCTNPSAVNFDQYATEDDGSCIIEGCTDSAAANHNTDANEDNGSCLYPGCTDSSADNYDSTANDDDGSCDYTYPGCMDSLASNYDPEADEDDGSCEYPGCTDSSAENYDPDANYDDGSCIYPTPGCIDSLASNYDPEADEDDGSCEYPGCTDSSAENYNPDANYDDGSCSYPDWE